ncbi:MAG: tRNA pseudouridine(55) synthase TruB [Planctomycetales bacterium]
MSSLSENIPPFEIWIPPAHDCGVLNLNKPAGMTSRQVVDRVQILAGDLKVGHAGTLDPLATGVLLVAVGAGTRLISYLQDKPKHYRGEFLLGRESETEDVEGEVHELPNPPIPSREELEQAASQFVGKIQQVPPRFSAKKIGGRRAYKLARRGKEFELEPRTVVIHALQIVEYEYPKLVLDIHCGSGTYVRSLGRDLARQVGTAAVMSNLERTAIGSFDITRGVSPDDLTLENWRDGHRGLSRGPSIISPVRWRMKPSGTSPTAATSRLHCAICPTKRKSPASITAANSAGLPA